MAKKKTSKKSSKVQPIIDNVLPQNILPIGERVEENKNIYISQSVYKEIHRFTKNKTTNESGGMLIGNVVEEFGKTNIIINGFIEAKHCEATPTTLKFTHETWEYCHNEIEKKFPKQKIVGWIHTHPDFGIFLSEYDKFIQENFFKEEYQIAYVVDPIQNIEGFYFWINGKIERCKGFYKFDKMGTKIETEEEIEIEQEKETSIFNFKNILIAVLSICVLFLFFSNLSQNNEIDRLEKQQQILANSANQSLSYKEQQISSLLARIEALEKLHQPQNENVTSNEETKEEPNATENNSDEDSNKNSPNSTTTDNSSATSSATSSTGSTTSAVGGN